MDEIEGDTNEKRAVRCDLERLNAFDKAFASACVFPGNSLEYPVANVRGFMPGQRATRTHPTQKAVCKGTQLSDSASSNAFCM